MSSQIERQTLFTRRLILEPLGRDHASILFTHFQHKSLYEFLPFEPPGSVEALRARYQRLEPGVSPDGTQIWLNWAMRARESDGYIGTLEATLLTDQTAFIAYMVFPDFWRQGFAKEGCREILDHLFMQHRVSVVASLIDSCNVASNALVRSLGFRCGDFIPHADYFKGRVSDEYRHEMDRKDWLKSTAHEDKVCAETLNPH